MQVKGRRYIVCLNEDEARKDAADREAIVASLQEKLRRWGEVAGRQQGLSPLAFPPGPDHFQIDEAKIKEEARYDGKWVLRTNADLDAAEVALQYKRLWMVEAWFRSSKSLLQTRPIYHKCDETIRGHVFCSFLALVLRQELEVRLAKDDHNFEWADVIQDLDRLQMVEVEQDGKRFLLGQRGPGHLWHGLPRGTGSPVPPTVQQASPECRRPEPDPGATPRMQKYVNSCTTIGCLALSVENQYGRAISQGYPALVAHQGDPVHPDVWVGHVDPPAVPLGRSPGAGRPLRRSRRTSTFPHPRGLPAARSPDRSPPATGGPPRGPDPWHDDSAPLGV